MNFPHCISLRSSPQITGAIFKSARNERDRESKCGRSLSSEFEMFTANSMGSVAQYDLGALGYRPTDVDEEERNNNVEDDDNKSK